MEASPVRASINRPPLATKCTNGGLEGVGLVAYSSRVSAPRPLPCGSALLLAGRLTRPLSSRWRSEDPGGSGRGERAPSGSASWASKAAGPLWIQRPRASKFPELGIPEVRPGKARTAMLAEALRPMRSLAAKPDQARSLSLDVVEHNRSREVGAGGGSGFSRLVSRTNPGSTLQPLLP